MSSLFASFGRIALSTSLTLGLLASLSACGSSLPTNTPAALASLAAADTSNPQPITDITFLDEVFSTLDAGGTADKSVAGTPAKADRWNQLKKDHADLAGKFEALKNLSPDERKAKMAAVAKDHPELVDRFYARPHFGPGPQGPRPEFGPQGPKPFDPAAFKAKNPELTKAFEALKGLKPEEAKSKIDALRKDHPDWFPAPPNGAPGFGPGFGPHPGFAPPDLKAKNPDLAKAMEALKDAKPEERQAKFEELRKSHPDWFPAPPAFGPPMGRPMMAPKGHPMGNWAHRPAPAAKPAE